MLMNMHFNIIIPSKNSFKIDLNVENLLIWSTYFWEQNTYSKNIYKVLFVLFWTYLLMKSKGLGTSSNNLLVPFQTISQYVLRYNN